MNKVILGLAGALMAFAVFSSWSEIERYRRMMSM
jgi:uncharacterized membrane protein YeaQ/YmgE (transglycosylase-associated protein family)